MSEDLKTLKEINQYAPVYEGYKGDINLMPVVSGDYIKKDELRDSAIEDVKKYSSEAGCLFISPFDKSGKACEKHINILDTLEGRELKGKVDYIMEKFNLTEEDLK